MRQFVAEARTDDRVEERRDPNGPLPPEAFGMSLDLTHLDWTGQATSSTTPLTMPR